MTNWSQTFNLTCLATDVYPLPEYLWKRIACVNGFTHSTCIFTPSSATDMIEAKCVILNIDVFGDKLASKSVQLKFKCKYTFSVSFYNDFWDAQDEIKTITVGKFLGYYIRQSFACLALSVLWGGSKTKYCCCCCCSYWWQWWCKQQVLWRALTNHFSLVYHKSAIDTWF